MKDLYRDLRPKMPWGIVILVALANVALFVGAVVVIALAARWVLGAL